MPYPLSVECVSLNLNKSTSYLSLCLSLNSFCDETSRTWASLGSESRYCGFWLGLSPSHMRSESQAGFRLGLSSSTGDQDLPWGKWFQFQDDSSALHLLCIWFLLWLHPLHLRWSGIRFQKWGVPYPRQYRVSSTEIQQIQWPWAVDSWIPENSRGLEKRGARLPPHRKKRGKARLWEASYTHQIGGNLSDKQGAVGLRGPGGRFSLR